MLRLLRGCLLAVGLLPAALGPAHADVVTEIPWHPAAASYRTMLFLADLEPVAWDLVLDAYERAHPAAASSRPAREFFGGLEGDAGDAIVQAIAGNDRQTLYETASRGLSRLIRQALAEAAGNLSEPGGASRSALEAQALYRTLGEFIEQADPEAGRRLGLAWLELTSAVGSAGVMGVGAVAADVEAFATARTEIETYLIANFEPEAFTLRRRLTPLPETVVATRGEVEVAPWLPPGSDLNDQVPLPMLVLNFERRGIDETDLPLVALGDMLFDSPLIFGDPARSLGISCATCHNRSDINSTFFIPGISHQPGAIDVRGSFFNPMFNDRRGASLDIPSLRGLRFTGPYGRDGRFASLRDFTRNVIVSEFGGPEPTPFMLDALIAYMIEFDFLPNSLLDAQGRLTQDASEAARRGEVLFRQPFPQMDGQSCASCHVPSANFLDRRAHNIGSGSDGYGGARDGTFDTPTLLGARFTAPYFHDGSLPTLASVVDWFDGTYRLELSEAARSDLTAYLEAVGDADEPYQAFEGRDSVFRLAWEELTTFASTFETLLPLRDGQHASLMLATVAGDLTRDASGMTNMAAKPRVYELSALLVRLQEVVDEGDWDRAATLWEAFRQLQDDYDEDMY